MNALAQLRDKVVRKLADTKVYDELGARTAAMPVRHGMQLQVMGASLPRTATMSMHAAMLTLGLRTFHGTELTRDKAVAERWIAVLKRDLKYGTALGTNWEHTMQGYEAAFDVPICEYWRELADAFPNAKVIYTPRESQAWFRSWTVALGDPYLHSRFFSKAVLWFPSIWRMFKIEQLAMKRAEREDGGYRPELIDIRLEQIKTHLSPDRLLVYHPRQGWGPLCAFLNLPIPDEPFPNLNDGPSLAWLFQMISVVGMSLHVLAAGVTVWISMWLYGKL